MRLIIIFLLAVPLISISQTDQSSVFVVKDEAGVSGLAEIEDREPRPSVFLGHYLGYQLGISGGRVGFESLNSTAFLAVHNRSNILIGGVASLNVLMKIPFNEVGFLFGYSNHKLLAAGAVKSYQSNFQGTGIGVQVFGGYTFEFQRNVGIGPSFSVGSLWIDNQQQFTVSIGVLIKQLKL